MIIEGEERDISKSTFDFPCFKKGKNGDKEYHAYLLADYLVLTQVAISIQFDQQGPNKMKYELPIQLSTHVKWEMQEFLDDGKKKSKLVSFKFQQVLILFRTDQVKKQVNQCVAKVICFRSDDSYLNKLKNLLRNRVIFQRIQDVYTPLQTIGKGSSARVLLVWHKNTEVYYAAKCIDKAYVNDSEHGLESMFQEIRIQRLVDHPSFITLHSVYEGDNTFYMVMDLLEGKSLHDELNNHKSGFPLEICRMIMLQLMKGIEYMHSLDIMHRDLKPENLMLQRKSDLNSLKIVDFGLATFQHSETYFYPKCGTPGYVAPEIANLEDKTKKYDKVCDIFSAGVIFFKIITGKDLFPGQGFNLVLKLNKQCKIDLTPLHMKKVPQGLINLISRMLEKEPTMRPSASEVLKDPFFYNPSAQEEEAKPKPTPAQKKQFFQGLKNDKLAQTAEFTLNSDEHTHHVQYPQGQSQRPPNSHIQKTQSPTSNKGSFVVQDNAYKVVAKPSQFQKVKFNTSEFDQYDLGQGTQHPITEKIEEEEEKK